MLARGVVAAVILGNKKTMHDGQDKTRKISESQVRVGRDGLCVVCGKIYAVKFGEKPLCPLDTHELIALPYLDETLVGHYVYKGLLGIGGMGVVYKALNSYLDKIVAIKTLKGKRYTEKELLRFQQEGKLLAKLVHPNLVSVMDFGVNNAQEPYMVLEYLEGKSLAALLKAEGVLEIDEALALTLQAASGLAHAHSYGAVHRDIKPGNIFITQTKEGPLVKVFDFGIAKLFFMDDPGARADLTKTGEIFGSPLYMSPEQALGKGLDERSDLYSLGCVLYEMLTGKQPIVGESAMETIFKHVSVEPLTLAEAYPARKFPPQLQQFIDLLLTKDRDDRLASAEQLVRLLKGIIENNRAGLAELKSLAAKLERKGGRLTATVKIDKSAADKGVLNWRKVALLGGVLVLLVGGAAGTFFYLHKPKPALAEVAPAIVVSDVDRQNLVLNEAPSELGFIDTALNPSDNVRHNLIAVEMKKGRGSFKFLQGVTFKHKDFEEIGRAGRHLKSFEFDSNAGLNAENLALLQPLNVADVQVRWGDIDDAGLAALVKISGLRNLKLVGCTFLTNKALKNLDSATGLTSLCVADICVDGRYVGDLSADWLSDVRFLGMRDWNKYGKPHVTHSDVLAAKLGKCTQLKTVTLEASDISNAGLKALATLPHLDNLSLRINGLTDSAVPIFMQMKKLKVLDLTSTKISKSAAERLLRESRIEHLKVSPGPTFNQLSPYLKEQIAGGRLSVD